MEGDDSSPPAESPVAVLVRGLLSEVGLKDPLIREVTDRLDDANITPQLLSELNEAQLEKLFWEFKFFGVRVALSHYVATNARSRAADDSSDKRSLPTGTAEASLVDPLSVVRKESLDVVRAFANAYRKARVLFVDIEQQRTFLGMPYLKKCVPFGLDGVYPVFNPYYLKPFGNATKEVSDAVESARLQSKKVVALVGASGSGKTKSFYSLADDARPCYVLTVYNSFGTGRNHPALHELAAILDALRGRERWAFGNWLSSLLPTSRTTAPTVADTALDYVRLYVAAFALWVLAVSKELQLEKGAERRRMWLMCLESGAGKDGVASIFRDLVGWAEQRSHANVKGFVASVFERLCTYAAEEEAALVVFFDEIGATAGVAAGLWYHLDDYKNNRMGSEDVERRRRGERSEQRRTRGLAQPADLLYAVRLVMLWLCGVKSCDIVPALADTDYSVLVLRDLKARSPINGDVTVVDTFAEVTVADMRSFLKDTIGLDVPDGNLEAFRGRPAFFAKLLCAFFRSPKGNALSAIDQFYRAREVGLAEAKYVLGRMITDRADDVHLRPFIGRLVRAAVFASDAPTCLMSRVYIDEGDDRKNIASSSLVFCPRANDRYYDVRLEPAVVDALRTFAVEMLSDGAEDLVLADIMSQILPDSGAGVPWEAALAWCICKWATVVRKRMGTEVLPLGDVLRPFFPPDFVAHSDLCAFTVTISQVRNCEGREPYEVALNDPSGICCRVSHAAHADIVFAAERNGDPAIVAIQCKAWNSRDSGTPMAPALESVSSGIQYLQSNMGCTYGAAFEDGTAKLSFHTHRAAFEALLARPEYSALEKNWVRCVASVQQRAETVRAVNAHNAVSGRSVRDSVVLLCGSSAAVGPCASAKLKGYFSEPKQWTERVWKHWTVREVSEIVKSRVAA